MRFCSAGYFSNEIAFGMSERKSSEATSDVTGATLSRFYGLHVAVLPAIMTVLLGLHLILIQRQGMSVPIGIEKKIKERVARWRAEFAKIKSP